MKQIREDLQAFDLAKLDEIRNLRAKMYCGGNNKLFFEELEYILKRKDYSESKEWARRDNDEVILGEVWEQPIGEVEYKNTIHIYSYLYVETIGLAIGEHGHNELVHDGKDIKKTKEFYVFPDGVMTFCDKDETHSLVNQFGKPIYVISLKIKNRPKSKNSD